MKAVTVQPGVVSSVRFVGAGGVVCLTGVGSGGELLRVDILAGRVYRDQVKSDGSLVSIRVAGRYKPLLSFILARSSVANAGVAETTVERWS